MQPARRKLYSYAGVVALYVLVFGWWIFFFAHQSEFLLRRLEQPPLLAGRNQQLQLLGRMQGLLGRAGPQAAETQEPVAEAVQGDDGGPQQDTEQPERPHHR